MKRSGIILASAALNLILVAVLVASRGQHPDAPSAHAVTKGERLPELAVKEVNRIATNMPPRVLLVSKFHWELIESADYREYIANLRAVACPERLVRDIIVADVQKLYASKAREVFSARDDWQPWQGSERRRAHYQQRVVRIGALKAEQSTLLKELLGLEWSEGGDEMMQQGDFALLLGFLSEPKPSQILGLVEEFSDATRLINDQARGILLAEDREQLAALRRRAMMKLAGLVSPSDYEELSLRAQNFGKFMNGDLHLEGITLSGSELRQLSGISRITGDVIEDELFNLRGEPSEAEEERRQEVFEAEVKKLLGADRFADFQRAQQPEFRDALNFTEEHDLPLSAAAKVGDAIRHANEQADGIKQNQSLSPDEQAAALTVLKSVTVNALASALGSKYAEYAKERNSNWNDLFEMPSDSREESP